MKNAISLVLACAVTVFAAACGGPDPDDSTEGKTGGSLESGEGTQHETTSGTHDPDTSAHEGDVTHEGSHDPATHEEAHHDSTSEHDAAH